MSNAYTAFCNSLRLTTPDERAWWKDALEEVTAPDSYNLPFDTVPRGVLWAIERKHTTREELIENDPCSLDDFHHRFDDEGIQFYGDGEDSGWDVVAILVQTFLRQFKQHKLVWPLTVVFYGDKMGDNEAGGVAILVTHDAIWSLDLHGWIEEQKEAYALRSKRTTL